MIYPLKPWTRAAFELIAHSELHYRVGADFDRRIAHIGFDNSVEVAIATYLGLHPIQRSQRSYTKDDVTRWLANYHTKIEFLAIEAKSRGYTLTIPADEILYYHKIRNDQYHGGGTGVPESDCVQALRTAAIEVFGFLFDVPDVERTLEDWLEASATTEEPGIQGDKTADWLLDESSQPVIIAGRPYPMSEALRAVDPNAYREVVAGVSESRDILAELRGKYPGAVRDEIVEVRIVHYEDLVCLKTIVTDGTLSLLETSFIADDSEENGCFFSSARDPDDNASRLVTDLDPCSFINCFDLLRYDAAVAIAGAYEAVRASETGSTGDNAPVNGI